MLQGASTAAAKVDNVFLYITALSVAFLVLITATMVAFVVRYRRRAGVQAQDIEGHVGLEVAWTLIPLVLFLSMFYYGWTNYRYLRSVPRDAMVVKVTGRQWAWSFTYPDGRRTAELAVAQGKPVKLELESLDVVHGFYIPALRVKQDVVPGKANYTWFQPTEVGTYDIECTVICGVNHSYMLSKVHVLPLDRFRAWYAGPPDEPIEPLVQSAESGDSRFKRKGCVACHSTDGTKLVGPSLKGVYGRSVTVVTAGRARQLVADDEYLARSIRAPNADVVQGFPAEMTKLEVSDADVERIVAYLRTLR